MRTRSGATDTASSSCGRAPTPPPNPPPTPTLADAMATLINISANNARILQALVQNRVPAPQGCQDPPPNNTYANFLKTHPPVFQKAEEPLEADDWIRTIEQKLGLIRCSDVQKTLFAAHQLQGPVGAWWPNFLATHPVGHQVPWAAFRTAFRAHHILEGVMEMKLEQFLRLQQGSQNVTEYLGKFNHLSQYAPEHVSTDAKKKRWFIRGLSTKIQTMLTACTTASYNEIVNIAIASKEKNCLHKEAKKRKNVHVGFSGGNNQRQRIVYQSGHHPSYHLPQQHDQQQSSVRPAVVPSYPRQLNTTSVHPNNPPNNTNLPYYNYGKIGHFSRDCRLPRQNNAPRPPMNQQNNNQQQNNQQNAQKKGLGPKTGQVHYI